MNSIILCSIEYSKSATDWLTAIFNLLLVLLTSLIAYIAKRGLYGNTVSNSRPPYISTLRMSFAELHGSLLSKDMDNIIKAIYLVEYHLNPHEIMNIDNTFIENCLDKLLEKAKNKQEITHDEINKYRKWSSAILQYEWQCFKDEISKGRKLRIAEKMKNKNEIIDAVLVGL